MPAEPADRHASQPVRAYERLAAAPARPIAGGTDVMVSISGELGPVPIGARPVAPRRAARDRDGAGSLVLGARTTYTEIRRSTHCPSTCRAGRGGATIGEHRSRTGADRPATSPTPPRRRHAARPARGDPVILVGGQRGEPRSRPRSSSSLPQDRARAHELILQVRIPIPAGRSAALPEKVGTRRAQAISKVVMALAWRDLGTAGWVTSSRARSVAAKPIGARDRGGAGRGPPTPRSPAAPRRRCRRARADHDVRSTADTGACLCEILHRLRATPRAGDARPDALDAARARRDCRSGSSCTDRAAVRARAGLPVPARRGAAVRRRARMFAERGRSPLRCRRSCRSTG